MKGRLIGGLLAAVLLCVIYNSNWFQRKFVYPLPYKASIVHYGTEYGVDPLLIAAVIRNESKFFAQARSSRGAVGLMQLMPETATWIAGQQQRENFALSELEDPDSNIRMGAWYLASLQKEFDHNEVLMLAAYNGGRGNVKNWMREYGWSMQFGEIGQIPYPETREYAERVLKSKQRYQQLYTEGM